MPTLHLDPESAHTTSRHLSQDSIQAQAELQALHVAIQQLNYAWQGGASEQFTAEMQELMRRLDLQVRVLDSLTSRLQREIIEWEEIDLRGAALMREGSLVATWQAGTLNLPITAGSLNVLSSFATPILPMLTAMSIGQWLEDVPTWLKEWLSKLFPPEQATFPEPQQPKKSALGELLGQPSPSEPTPDVDPRNAATPSAETSILLEPPLVNTTNTVPLKSQGNLYGSAACTPTSVSMVLDYYHNQDASLKTASPETLIGMLDPGDGTPGKGMSLSNLTDELADLGYHNVNQKVNANLEALQTQVQGGPVIITTGVRLTGPGTLLSDVPRAILGPGNTIHAMVVTKISEGIVSVNDPWTGQALSYTQQEFDAIWSGGSRGLYAIRP